MRRLINIMVNLTNLNRTVDEWFQNFRTVFMITSDDDIIYDLVVGA